MDILDQIKEILKNNPNTNSSDEDIRIVVLQRGWILVGKYKEANNTFTMTDSCVIEKWGTTEGLGELYNGPTNETRLRKNNGEVNGHVLTIVFSIKVDNSKWEKIL